MKKLYGAISDIIMPGIAFAAIVAILAGGALLQKTGQRMDVDAEDFSGYADTEAVDAACRREGPSISCTGKKIWGAGEPIPIDSLFLSTDMEGNRIQTDVTGITDEDGNSAMDSYQEASRTALFKDRGVYTFHLSALDSERKETLKKVSIVVDGR